MESRQKLYEMLQGYLEEMFEIPPDKVLPTSRLFEDLDLDSIDAVDLIVKLQEVSQRKFTHEEFKSVRTVDDILDRLSAVLVA